MATMFRPSLFSLPDADSSSASDVLTHAMCDTYRESSTADITKHSLKRAGWYYGSISPEFAGKLLQDEEDGTFLIRDSSSDCFIFSITFILEGQVSHAHIEHNKGKFGFEKSFPSYSETTIVGFVEKAIKESQKGKISFFLHRGPSTAGPVRLQLKPLLRMKARRCSASLKHMCRFAILPYVRRDKINELALPECLREYLNEPFS